ncbi:uncharacterized protein K452DRAFT_286365 [Aplosporella prunicola CBS 121167]|uniref:Uncharacterized protein n=1 Tax=Aplosporella prunicola CBS 121167 TaxID=1176127 RepID=A0A6A6BEZ9_9PEZI|nr:uncharacterized protein K452DRAFT_286365 [Aplosporella prunicola CBS 121167]KAF2142730.1 hypothetical protein K452DRAFT_286365 [Aplosporella prunicola CBS 121167]
MPKKLKRFQKLLAYYAAVKIARTHSTINTQVKNVHNPPNNSPQCKPHPPPRHRRSKAARAAQSHDSERPRRRSRDRLLRPDYLPKPLSEEPLSASRSLRCHGSPSSTAPVTQKRKREKGRENPRKQNKIRAR